MYRGNSLAQKPLCCSFDVLQHSAEFRLEKLLLYFFFKKVMTISWESLFKKLFLNMPKSEIYPYLTQTWMTRWFFGLFWRSIKKNEDKQVRCSFHLYGVYNILLDMSPYSCCAASYVTTAAAVVLCSIRRLMCLNIDLSCNGRHFFPVLLSARGRAS